MSEEAARKRAAEEQRRLEARSAEIAAAQAKMRAHNRTILLVTSNKYWSMEKKKDAIKKEWRAIRRIADELHGRTGVRLRMSPPFAPV